MNLFHSYVDDTQLYVAMSPEDTEPNNSLVRGQKALLPDALVFANHLLLTTKSAFPCMKIKENLHIGPVLCQTSSTGIGG